MDEKTNTALKDLLMEVLSKLTLRQILSIISSIVLVMGGTTYGLDSLLGSGSETEEMTSKIELLKEEKVDLKMQLMQVTGELNQCKMMVSTMEDRNKQIEPILKMLLEKYKKDIGK